MGAGRGGRRDECKEGIRGMGSDVSRSFYFESGWPGCSLMCFEGITAEMSPILPT